MGLAAFNRARRLEVERAAKAAAKEQKNEPTESKKVKEKPNRKRRAVKEG